MAIIIQSANPPNRTEHLVLGDEERGQGRLPETGHQHDYIWKFTWYPTSATSLSTSSHPAMYIPKGPFLKNHSMPSKAVILPYRGTNYTVDCLWPPPLDVNTHPVWPPPPECILEDLLTTKHSIGDGMSPPWPDDTKLAFCLTSRHSPLLALMK